MESFGIPCVHVIIVLVFLDIDKFPESLILKRWTMKAKEGVAMINVESGGFEDGCYISRIVSMNDSWRELTNVACRSFDDYNDVMDWITSRIVQLRGKHE